MTTTIKHTEATKKVAANLRTLLTRAGRDPQWLADTLGIGWYEACDLRAGRTEIYLHDLVTIAEALDFPVTDLFKETV